MTRRNDALANAFQLLVFIVRDFYSIRRPCLGATLKPELYRRANFSEQLLGFLRFGDFLRAAEAAGHVQLTATPGGDIAVWPVGVPIPALPARPSSALAQSLTSPGGSWPDVPVRVRQDLWNAFNSYSVNWVYNPVADIAYKQPDAAGARDAQGASVPPGLIQIPADRDRLLGWMRSFTNMQDPATKAQLSTVLEGDAGPYQFSSFVRLNTRLARTWGRFHVQQVLAAIESWAASNNLHPKDVAGPLYRSLGPSLPQVAMPEPPTGPVPQAAPATLQLASPPLAGRLGSLIDNLIDELLKLRGFLQVVGPKQ